MTYGIVKQTINTDIMVINRLRLLAIIVLSLLAIKLFSQDKRDYITPLGKNLYHKVVTDANGMVLPLSDISPVSSGKDGLTVVFSLRTNLSSFSKPLKLLSFMYDNESNTFVEVFYHNGTLSFRRRVNLLLPILSYDYELFDPLIDIKSGESTTVISLFFTSYFFWIETGGPNITVHDKRHSAVFFGIDIPTYTFMNKFLQRDIKAKLKFGDPNPPVVFTMPSKVDIYEFNYKDLKNELQTNFCDNN